MVTDRLSNIMRWLPKTYRYIGQVQNLRTRAWYLLCHDDFNDKDDNSKVVATKLLGGRNGQPHGTSQPRTIDQIIRLYGPIEETVTA